MSKKIVVIDDDQEMRSLLCDFFSQRGHQVTSYSSAAEAIRYFAPKTDVDLVISDVKMPGMSGIDFVAEAKKRCPHVPMILITAFGSVDTAVQALRAGAYDYIVKPFKLTELGAISEKALEFRQLQLEGANQKTLNRKWKFNHIIGKGSAIKGVIELIKRVSSADASVLISGESGTGKEVVARAIHDNGSRSSGPFIAINCTAIPETLLESELFGHAKGAFTGAHQKKMGLFEKANGGTLFLDEIGDMPATLQAKLLRVLQERKIRGVGETNTRDINVRIIAATHKNLKNEIRKGTFREDLYYRLSVIPIQIPPLRERTEDIPELAEHFLKKYDIKRNKSFTQDAIDELMSAHWEGNVRELENLIERAVVLTPGNQIDSSAIRVDTMKATENIEPASENPVSDWPTLSELERRYIVKVLKKTGGKKTKAANILGINRRTLYRKQLELDLSDDH